MAEAALAHRTSNAVEASYRRGDPARLDEGGIIVLVGPCHLPLQRLRQLGLLAARQFQNVAFACGHQIVMGLRPFP